MSFPRSGNGSQTINEFANPGGVNGRAASPHRKRPRGRQTNPAPRRAMLRFGQAERPCQRDPNLGRTTTFTDSMNVVARDPIQKVGPSLRSSLQCVSTSSTLPGRSQANATTSSRCRGLTRIASRRKRPPPSAGRRLPRVRGANVHFHPSPRQPASPHLMNAQVSNRARRRSRPPALPWRHLPDNVPQYLSARLECVMIRSAQRSMVWFFDIDKAAPPERAASASSGDRTLTNNPGDFLRLIFFLADEGPDGRQGRNASSRDICGTEESPDSQRQSHKDRRAQTSSAR